MAYGRLILVFVMGWVTKRWGKFLYVWIKSYNNDMLKNRFEVNRYFSKKDVLLILDSGTGDLEKIKHFIKGESQTDYLAEPNKSSYILNIFAKKGMLEQTNILIYSYSSINSYWVFEVNYKLEEIYYIGEIERNEASL